MVSRSEPSATGLERVRALAATFTRVMGRVIRQPRLLRLYAQRMATVLDLDIRLTPGYSFPPLVAYINLTMRCGQECEFCHVEKTFASVANELSVAQWRTIIDHLGPRPPILCLLGGDAFFFRHIEEILAYAITEKQMAVEIVTNGTLLDRNIDLLLRHPPVRLTVSLHGYGEVHDRVTGRQGAFDRAYSGLLALRDALKREGRAMPSISISMSFGEQNTRELARSVEQFIADGFRFFTVGNYQVIGGRGVEEHNRSHPEELHLTNTIGIHPETGQMLDIDGAQVFEELVALRRIGQEQGVRLEVCGPTERQEVLGYYDPTTPYPFNDRLCKLPWRHVMIAPNGDLSINACCFGGTFGNLLHESLPSLWNSPRLRKIRRLTLQERHFEFCGHCPSIFISNGYL